MASVTSEGVAGTDRRVVAPRLRAAVLGPRGGGTTRRRASDAFRLGLAAVVVAVSIPVMRANSAAELWLVHALNPPPEAIRWLVTSIFWLVRPASSSCWSSLASWSRGWPRSGGPRWPPWSPGASACCSASSWD